MGRSHPISWRPEQRLTSPQREGTVPATSLQNWTQTSAPPWVLLVYHTGWTQQAFISGTSGKEPTCQCRRHKRFRFDPCQESLEEEITTHSSILAWRVMDRAALWATVHGVVKSQTQLKWLSTNASFHNGMSWFLKLETWVFLWRSLAYLQKDLKKWGGGRWEAPSESPRGMGCGSLGTGGTFPGSQNLLRANPPHTHTHKTVLENF